MSTFRGPWWDRGGAGHNVMAYGAVGDAVADDTAALQAASDAAGENGRVLLPKPPGGFYRITGPLTFRGGQQWDGDGGVDVLGDGVEIRLTSSLGAGIPMVGPHTPASTTYHFRADGIYFNALGNADVAFSLYNTSYARLIQCGANVTRANAAAILLDSNVSLQCYFNVLDQCRVFASGAGGVGARFTRGANVNMVLGGKFGSSTRGMEFLSLSSGNVIIGTDFEDNTDRHVYADAPSNVFVGCHMETAPIGFDLTANAHETMRIGTSFATNCVINVQEALGLSGNVVLENRREAADESGLLRVLGFAMRARYLSTGTNVDMDPMIFSDTANAILRLFLNTNTSGLRRMVFYRGDGSTVATITLDAAAGTITAESRITGGGLAVNQAAGNSRTVRFQSAGVDRWFLQTTSDAETGSSAGSNFAILSRNDDGTARHTVMDVARTNGIVRFPQGVGVGNAAAATTPGGVTHRIPVYDAAGALLGYVPVYDAIT